MPGSEKTLCVGIDAGRTKTLLRASYPGATRPAELSGPGLNVQHTSPDEAADRLAGLLETLCHQVRAPFTRAVVCAGLAGGGLAPDRQALAQRLKARLTRRFPTTRWALHLVDDGVIALQAALGGASGLVLIAGSGSLVLGRTRSGTTTRIGGWGSLLGDEGSGYVLGLEAMRAVARALDGGPATALQALVAERFNLTDRPGVIRQVYQNHWPLQEAAPLVMEASTRGDAVAQQILHTQTDALAERAERLGRRDTYAPTLYLTGGLVASECYRITLTDHLHRRLPEWAVHRSPHAPVAGALALAVSRENA